MSLIHALLVIDDDVVRRMGALVRHLCVGMIDEAVQVTVLSRSASPWTSEGVGVTKTAAIPRRRWPWNRPSSDDVLRVVGGQVPDIVHCMSADLADWVHGWCADWGSVLVVQLCDLDDVEQFVGLRSEARMMGMALTPSLERALLMRAPEMREQVRVVTPGLPAESTAAGMEDGEQTPTAIMTAPLTRGCGLSTVLRALRLVVKEGLEVHLFVLSGGPAEGRFRREVEDLDLRSRVTFAEPMRDWATTYKAMMAADFFINPGGASRFTITTLAALAGGLIVLAPAGGFEDYLVDGVNASLFEPQRHKQLAERWIALLKDRAAARKMAEAALEYARTHLQASAMVNRTAALYRQLSQAQPADAHAADRAV